MLRITTVETESAPRLRFEGRITEETSALLAGFSDGGLADSILDLSGVTYVDNPSVRLLEGLRARGAVLEGCSPFLSALLGARRAERDATPAAGEPAERELLEALRRGEERAFAALVRREGPRMLATARRMLGNDEDARDAVQDAFLQAHRALDRFAGESRLSTWLHRIVVNAALMKLRGRRRKPEQPLDDLLPQFDESGAWLRPVSGWERSADELVESAECRAIVRKAIDRLPDPYREVLVLRDIEELDTDETARVLGATPNAVKVRLHRARQALRTLLERDLPRA
jgi:RNA polymerase sigma-70 factor, ECF subfamily